MAKESRKQNSGLPLEKWVVRILDSIDRRKLLRFATGNALCADDEYSPSYNFFYTPEDWVIDLEETTRYNKNWVIDLFGNFDCLRDRVMEKVKEAAYKEDKAWEKRRQPPRGSPIREIQNGSEIKSSRTTLYPALGIGIGMIALGIALRPNRTTSTLEEKTEPPGLVQSGSTANLLARARGYQNATELILAQIDSLNALNDSLTALNRRSQTSSQGEYTEDQYQKVSRLAEKLGRDVTRLAAERDSGYAQRDRVVRTSSENAMTAAMAAKTVVLSAVVESLPRAAREFKYTRMETPTKIGFYSFRRPTQLDKVEDIVAEAGQLAGCRAELKVYGVTPAQVDSYATAKLFVTVAKNPFDGGILGVEITRR